MDTLPPIFRITSNRYVWMLVVLITFICVTAPVLSIAAALSFVPGLPPQAYWAILSLAVIIPLLIAPPIAIGALSILRLLTVTIDRLDSCIRYDPLTNVLSRAYLLSQMREHLAGGGSFMMIDADHFKSVNDTYGHDVGDEALKCLAQVIRNALPPEALSGRLGGEEFGVFLPRLTNSEAGCVANTLCEAVRHAGRMIADHEINLTISVGVAQHAGENTIEKTMKLADEALYHAKRTGRDRYHIAAANDLAGGSDTRSRQGKRRDRRDQVHLAEPIRKRA